MYTHLKEKFSHSIYPRRCYRVHSGLWYSNLGGRLDHRFFTRRGDCSAYGNSLCRIVIPIIHYPLSLCTSKTEIVSLPTNQVVTGLWGGEEDFKSWPGLQSKLGTQKGPGKYMLLTWCWPHRPMSASRYKNTWNLHHIPKMPKGVFYFLIAAGS